MLTLKPRTKQTNAPPFAVFDIEAKPRYQGEPLNTQFLGAGTFDGDTYKLHRTQAALVDHLFSPKFAGWVWYAHNASGYDLNFVLEELTKRRVEFEAYKTGSRIFLTVGETQIFDSAVYLNGSLEAVAESLKTTHRKLNVKHDPNFFAEIEHKDWQPYLEADCRTLFDCLVAIRSAIATLGVDLRSTIASTAMDLWQSRYLDHEISIPRYYHRSEADARSSYVGGRCEVFTEKIDEGCSFDINSSYPYQMLSPVPAQYLASYQGTTLPPYSIAQATIEIPRETYYPPLHFHDPTNGRLLFPTGKLHGYYTSAELEYCRTTFGTNSVTVYSAHAYEPQTLFADYIRDLYATRQRAKREQNHALDMASKLLMNSLYGKFGQNRQRSKIVCGERWRDWPFNDKHALDKAKRVGKHLGKNERLDLKQVYSHEHDIYGVPDFVEFGPTIQPAIASWITASGRLHLQRLLDKSHKRVAYCDTDSVYVSGNDAELLFAAEINSELGGLKLEQRFTNAHFIAPKCYEVTTKKETTYKAKGVPKSSDRAAFLRGEPVKVRRMVGIIENLSRTGKVTPKSETQTKQRQTFTHKRHANAPLDISELTRQR